MYKIESIMFAFIYPLFQKKKNKENIRKHCLSLVHVEFRIWSEIGLLQIHIWNPPLKIRLQIWSCRKMWPNSWFDFEFDQNIRIPHRIQIRNSDWKRKIDHSLEGRNQNSVCSSIQPNRVEKLAQIQLSYRCAKDFFKEEVCPFFFWYYTMYLRC